MCNHPSGGGAWPALAAAFETHFRTSLWAIALFILAIEAAPHVNAQDLVPEEDRAPVAAEPVTPWGTEAPAERQEADGPATAEEPAAMSAPEEPTEADHPEVGLIERVTLTGECGMRTKLEENAIRFGLTTFNDVQTVVSGGLARRTYAPGLVEATLTLDLDRLFGWCRTLAFFRGLGMYGRDPTEGTGSLNAPSNLGNSVGTIRLFEGWIEPTFFDEMLSIRAGMYAVDTEFDVKETAAVLMNGGFGTGVDLSQSGRNGPCIYSTSCLGVRVGFHPTPNWYAQVALVDGVAGNPNDPYGTHVILNRDEGMLTLGEVGYTRGVDEGGFIHAAMGMWYYTRPFDDILQVDANGNPQQTFSKPGVYALLEGALYTEQGKPTQGLSAFIRVGMADQNVNQVQYYAAGGFAYTGFFPGRDEDVAALGVSVPINGSRYKTAQELAGNPVRDLEAAIEATYWVPVLPSLSMQVDAQYIVNPGTDPTIDNALVLGMRTRIVY